jgi:hypothetical protein
MGADSAYGYRPTNQLSSGFLGELALTGSVEFVSLRGARMHNTPNSFAACGVATALHRQRQSYT